MHGDLKALRSHMVLLPINHFARFLQHINHPRAYETLLAEDYVADGTLLGMFRLIYQIQRRSRCEVHMTGTYLGYIIIRLSDQFSLQMKLTEDKYTRLRIALRSLYLDNAAT